MKLRKLLALSFVLLAATAVAQIGNTTTIVFPGVPSGKCQPTQLGLNKANGDLYSCNGGTWAKQGGTGVGTVTQVNGTANQVDIANPTTTPTVSLDPAVQIGSATSLVPTGTGQIVGNTGFYNLANGISYPFQPTYTVSNTGGSLIQGTYYFRLTYVGLGTTVPSAETRIQLNATNCASNTTCQITVNMPTGCTAGNLPAGATGCTVWDNNTVVNAELQQAASNACVNITTATCVVNVKAAGSALTFPTSSGKVPSSVTAIAQPNGLIPTTYMQIGDGSFIPVAGVDYSAINVTTPFAVSGQNCPAIGCMSGRFTWTAPFFFNDTNAVPIQANNLVSVHHLAGQTTGSNTSPGTGVDDRAFGVEMVDAGATNVNYEQSLSQYNERIVANNNMTCGPISGGLPYGESCFGAGRFIVSDTRTANASGNPANFFTAVAGVASSAGAGGFVGAAGTQASYVGGSFGAFQSVTSTAGNNNNWIAVYGGVNGATSNSAGAGYTYWAQAPGIRFATQNVGFYSRDFGSNTSDWNILSITNSPATSGNNMFQGSVFLPSIVEDNGTIPVTGSFSLTGSLTTAQLSAPAAPIVSPTNPGAQTCAYKLTAVDGNGNETTGSAQTSQGNCNANITPTNSVTITAATQKGVSSYNVYRTVEAGNCNGIACTNGKIGNVVASAMTTTQVQTAIFTDTGQVGDGNTAVAQANLTAGEKLTGYAQNLNKAWVTTDFTSANSAALQVITGLTWNLGTAAQKFSIHCSLMYSQATNVAGDQFGIAVTTTAPTNVSMFGTAFTNTGAASPVSTGVLTALATTTPTAIVTFSPAVTTVLGATLDGTVESAAGANSVLNIYVLNGTAADVIVVKRGSYCELY